MKYKHFEEVPVWNAGVDLTKKVFEVTEGRAFRGRGDNSKSDPAGGVVGSEQYCRRV